MLILLPIKFVTCITAISVLYCVATSILVWTREVARPTQVNLDHISQNHYGHVVEEQRGQQIGNSLYLTFKQRISLYMSTIKL